MRVAPLAALPLALLAALMATDGCSSSTTQNPDGGPAGADGSSGSSGSSSGGSGGEAGPSPDAFIAATVGVGPQSGPQLCNFSSVQPWLDVGTPVAGKPTTQEDGSNQGGAPVHVTCTVAASGSGFDVELSVTQQGLSGANVTISSPAGAGALTLTGGSGITAVFQSSSLATYRETDCTITFTYNGAPVPDQPPVAAARIWGHISCPAAQIAGQTVTGPDGGMQNRQCDAEADFLFENCGK